MSTPEPVQSPRRSSPGAIVLAHGLYRTDYAKTAHGLVRGPSRWPVFAVVDPDCAGDDAGLALDGRPRGIPVVRDLAQALDGVDALDVDLAVCIVGVATPGGALPDDLHADLVAAARAGLTLVNGLHRHLAEDPAIVDAARTGGAELVDLRKPPESPHFWTGEILRCAVPRIAVLGTDCALGKRTTGGLLRQALAARGLRAEMVTTGQTGWLQGYRHGFILDTAPNDFVCGELEHWILRCVEETSPDVVLLEGQSALRNPSGPCGAELLLAGGAAGVVLQHAPGRSFHTGLDALGRALGEEGSEDAADRLRIGSVADEVELIRAYGVDVWAVGLHEGGLAADEAEAERARLERELDVPVVLPLRDGEVGRLADVVHERLEQGRSPSREVPGTSREVPGTSRGSSSRGARRHRGIVEVEVRHERVPLSRPYAIASTAGDGGTDAIDLSLVVLRGTDGALGIGTASSAEHVTGESSVDTAAALDDLGWLDDVDPRRIGDATARLVSAMPVGAPAARAAVDMALWDLHARALGVPLWTLWGGRRTGIDLARGLPTSITLGIRSVDETIDEAREALGRGFRALKAKIGLDAAEDAERLERLRALAGPDVALRVDANEGYGPSDLATLAALVDRLDLEMVEQPVPRDRLAELGAGELDIGELNSDAAWSDLRPRLAADESLIAPDDVAPAARACGIFVLKLMKHGGPTPARDIARRADALERTVMWGCNDESAASITAALHCALVEPATRWLDLDGSFDLARDVVRGGFRLSAGRLIPVDAPGLGVELID